MIRRILAAAIVIAAQHVYAAGDALFDDANRAYAAGDFAKAADNYEQVVRGGRVHANLFYDLANAWYRAGDDGKAILNYERTLALEPHHPEAEANLRIARERARALEFQPSSMEKYLAFATPRALTITATVAFWLAVFVALSLLIRRSRSRIALLVCSFLLFCAAACGVYLAETGVRGRALAIVTAKDVQARVATADSSASVLALAPGSEVSVLSARGDWTYVALPNNQRGWLPANAIEQVRL
jgi:tetratricopeptide (TPR) repeat protein